MTSVGVRQHTQDVRVCPSAHKGHLGLSVCVHVCPSAHTGRTWLSISTHINTLVLGLSTLTLPADCSDDFGPSGLCVQYTQDVRGCLPAHTVLPWLSVCVRVCPSVSVSTQRTSVAVHQYTYQHVVHTGRPWVSASTHRTSVGVRQYTYQHVGSWTQHADPSRGLFGASVCVRQHTQDVRVCPSAHTGRSGLSVCVCVCPSAHTGGLWLSISTHINTLVLGLSTLALPVDCLGDFGPRGLSVQYTQDVRGCPQRTQHVCGCLWLSDVRSCLWLSVSTHRTSVCVCQHTQDVRVCPRVPVSTHRTSVAVHQYTYQHAGPWTQHAVHSFGLFGTFGAVRVCPCVSISTHRTYWLSISTHINTLVLGLSTLTLPADCSDDFGPRGLCVQYTQDVRGCLPAHTVLPWLFVCVRVCPSVSVSTQRTSVAVHQDTYQHYTQDVRGCPPAHTRRLWLSVAVRQHTQDVRGYPGVSVCVCGCPPAHTGRSWLSVAVQSHQTVQTGHLGGTSDRGSVQGVYLYNQKDFQHETNFIGFYTQEGVQPNWKRAKIFTEQEVMNFTSQKFPSPSICEYPTLEGDSSPRKERPEAKPIIGVKRSLSAFQKAKDQEKWTRKSEDMFNLPEPVKPVLHSPQLEANRFNQLQTRNWRPGDHFNQSGGIPEVLSCTRTQEISRFNGESLKSNRSYLWKDWTIFRFDPFQAIPIQPGEPDDVQTKPRHPVDIIHEPEEFYNFIPCTSPHRNKKIPIITKLPYLESLAFKLQQLFFYQGKDEISIYQAFKKVPRKLSYPLKPSRFKQIKFLHLEPKFHKRLQQLLLDVHCYIVSRSKPCQEGGDVVVTKSMVQPESHQTVQTGHLGGTSDRGSVQGVYLYNQKDFQHETNFIGFYTQEGVQPNWKRAKIFTEQEVMNFTSQKFPSPSICEYPTLEGDSSPRKERPEAKPIIGVKRSLSAFQKAKDQEKWTRKSEDMFNLPEPVKPVLHSPQLEANRFNQLQTRNWRPGDHFNQSGGIPEVLSCTRTQEISRFNGESLKSNRSYVWKDWTIFRFDPFQAIPIQPGEPDDVQTKPRHPVDIIHEPE
ncbi:hypothetical protein YC2023_066298 [Brassica napus]